MQADSSLKSMMAGYETTMVRRKTTRINTNIMDSIITLYSTHFYTLIQQCHLGMEPTTLGFHFSMRSVF